MQIEVFFSYACRDTYKVFAWLEALQQQDPDLAVIWHPFAVELDSDEDWGQPWQTARSELRGFIAAEAAREQGDNAFRRFHQALERAVHEQYLELGDEQTLLDAAQQARLDVTRFQAALYTPEMPSIVRQSHQRGVEQFKVFGTPTLIFPQNQSIYLELSQVPEASEAFALLESVKSIDGSEHPYIQQIKRTQ